MWIYEQNTGRLITPAGKLLAAGYAGGNCGKNPEGKNNHALQDKHNIGPLPVGDYTIGTIITEHTSLGKDIMQLFPFPENKMFGRGHFFIHGDWIGHEGNGSEGCIVMPHDVRIAVANSDDKHLRVVYTGA